MPTRPPEHSTHGYAESFVACILQDALSSLSKPAIYGVVGLQGTEIKLIYAMGNHGQNAETEYNSLIDR
jgi:hypothetical protein